MVSQMISTSRQWSMNKESTWGFVSKHKLHQLLYIMMDFQASCCLLAKPMLNKPYFPFIPKNKRLPNNEKNYGVFSSFSFLFFASRLSINRRTNGRLE